MPEITGIVLGVLLLTAGVLWVYARAYPRRSVNPADYPYSQQLDVTPAQWADRLLARMTRREKQAQLSGDGGALVLLRLAINIFGYRQFPNMYAGYNRRRAIPPLSFTDGPRGIVVGRATGFPVAMARGATWDVALERRVGEVLGREARAVGANYFAGVCVNLLRHPGWGRAQETWGEDGFHVGEMAAACIEGVQHHNVMACVKHFAVNSIENNRFFVDVRIDDRTLHEVFLPQFQRCVEAGVASVMSAYNRVNGDYCAHQRWLLEDILRGQWGFDGFVSSDWVWGVHDAARGLNAGMDVEMPRANVYGRPLTRALRRGAVTPERLDECVRRVLTTKIRFAARPDPETYPRTVLACEAHRQLARETAEQAMVLLQNRDGLLPLSRTALRRVAVIGALAATSNTGDHGSSRTAPPTVVTLLDGLRAALGEDRVVFHDGRDAEAAAQVAAQADVALVVAGHEPEDEGENLMAHRKPGGDATVARGGDRLDLSLPRGQDSLIRTVAAAQPCTTVTLIGGSAITLDDWRESVLAILMAWYPGMEGGHAWARVLLGDTEPGGRLPFVWPRADNTLPAFAPGATTAEYDYYHGLTWFDHTAQTPAFPLGFGLGYTDWALAEPRVTQEADTVRVSVVLSNTGARTGNTVVQVYAGPAPETTTPVARHRKRLVAFAREIVAAGENTEVTLVCPVDRLRRYCPDTATWVLDPGTYRFWVGTAADEAACRQVSVTISDTWTHSAL